MCSSKQWSPEVDQVRLQVLLTSAKDKIEARNAQALELKYACYPTTRPLGWAPASHPLIDTDDDQDHQDEDNDDGDNDYYNAFDEQRQSSVQPLSQHFEEHLLQCEGGQNPSLNVLFGQSTVERLKARSNLLQQRRGRGRPRKNHKSSSGGRLPNGKMAQQMNGMTLDRHVQGPTNTALKGVTERTGGLVTAQTLVSENIIPGRIQVSTSLLYISHL